MSTSRSARQREVRRTQLLEAAGAVFVERGYFATRVADIARAAGASHGTFYTYFTSKDDVLRVLLDGMVDDLAHAAVLRAPAEEDPVAAMALRIRRFMDAYGERAGLIRILEQVASFDADFAGLKLQIKDRFIDLMERGVRAATAGRDAVPAVDPRYGALALGAMIEDIAYGCHVLHSGLDEELAVATMTRIWAATVGLPVAPDALVAAGSPHVSSSR